MAQLDVAENGGRSDAAVRFLSHCSCTISHLRCGLNVSVEPESFFHLETVKAAIYQIEIGPLLQNPHGHGHATLTPIPS